MHVQIFFSALGPPPPISRTDKKTESASLKLNTHQQTLQRLATIICSRSCLCLTYSHKVTDLRNCFSPKWHPFMFWTHCTNLLYMKLYCFKLKDVQWPCKNFMLSAICKPILFESSCCPLNLKTFWMDKYIWTNSFYLLYKHQHLI